MQSKSKVDEASWYSTPEGQKQTQREFERAIRAGKAVVSNGGKLRATEDEVLKRLVEQAKLKATKAISIRVPVADIERAKEVANKKGIGYQTVLKEAIRKGLQRVS